MGANPSVYSSVSGPAKWAAVVVLSFACGAGLVYSLGRLPRRSEAAGAVVRELPGGKVSRAAPSVPSPAVKSEEPKTAAGPVEQPKSEAAPQVPEAPASAPEAERVEPATVAPLVSEPEPPAPVPAASVGRKININTATQAELELLPRVGPATAKAIISYRSLHGPFRTVQDLDKVKGIGPKTLEKLAPLVTVD
ncbi:MAG TPA: helix-hairpin-helix domain-containing protein [Phycisphaerales bacterium]|nr:helix-hairpin-helix domain-containing protein [Phycisphaerales bacterium]